MSGFKNPKVQILRAVAIIAVVMVHTCPVGEMQAFVRPFVNFGVATFLFLSGYLTNVSKIETKHFYKKRILRVFIPYVIWSFLYTTVGLLGNGDGFDVKKYIINFVTAGGAPTLYYIFVYIQFVLLTPLLEKMIHKNWWWIGLLISPLALAINYYLLFSGATPNVYVSAIWKVCCLGWFFVLLFRFVFWQYSQE